MPRNVRLSLSQRKMRMWRAGRRKQCSARLNGVISDAQKVTGNVNWFINDFQKLLHQFQCLLMICLQYFWLPAVFIEPLVLSDCCLCLSRKRSSRNNPMVLQLAWSRWVKLKSPSILVCYACEHECQHYLMTSLSYDFFIQWQKIWGGN